MTPTSSSISRARISSTRRLSDKPWRRWTRCPCRKCARDEPCVVTEPLSLTVDYGLTGEFYLDDDGTLRMRTLVDRDLEGVPR